MLTLQSSKSRFVCLLIFKVNQDTLGDVILLSSKGVSFTEVQEGLIVRRGVSALHLLVSFAHGLELTPWSLQDKSLLVQGLSESYMQEHKFIICQCLLKIKL